MFDRGQRFNVFLFCDGFPNRIIGCIQKLCLIYVSSHATASHDQLLQRKATIQFLFQTDIDYSDGSSESVAALVLLELEEVRTFQDVA